MKFSTTSLIPVALAASTMLVPQALQAQDADASANNTAAMERVIGAMENPPSLADVESFEGTTQVVFLSDVQSGVTSATIGDVELLEEQNSDWLSELHTAIDANMTLSSAIEDADAEIEDVIALAPDENGDWFVFIDDESLGEAS